VPVISIYEVFKKVLRERGENDALQVASMMQGGQIVDLDYALALEAARHPLPLADSIIYATAMSHDAIFWTQDEHFKDLPSVRFFQEIHFYENNSGNACDIRGHIHSLCSIECDELRIVQEASFLVLVLVKLTTRSSS